MTPERATALAERLELELFSAGVCLPCLTFVAFPFDEGDEAEVARSLKEMTPILWADGLELPAKVALTKAARAGIADAQEALDDIASRSCRATIVRAIVRRLASDMVLDMHASFRAMQQ